MARTESMRRHLRAQHQATAAELAASADIEPKLVRALLKYDIDAGRIEIDHNGDRQIYRLVENPPPRPGLVKAIAELEELGYVVIAP